MQTAEMKIFYSWVRFANVHSLKEKLPGNQRKTARNVWSREPCLCIMLWKSWLYSTAHWLWGKIIPAGRLRCLFVFLATQGRGTWVATVPPGQTETGQPNPAVTFMTYQCRSVHPGASRNHRCKYTGKTQRCWCTGRFCTDFRCRRHIRQCLQGEEEEGERQDAGRERKGKREEERAATEAKGYE